MQILLYEDNEITFDVCVFLLFISSVLQEPKGSETGNFQLFETLLQAIKQFFEQVRLKTQWKCGLCHYYSVNNCTYSAPCAQLRRKHSRKDMVYTNL